MDLDTLIAQWSGESAAGLRPACRQSPEGATLFATEMQAPMRRQGQRGVFRELPALPRPPGGVMPQKARRPGRGRRLPQVRLPQAAGGRLPLRSGAARTGTSSARRSARTPWTPPRSSTISPPSPSACTRRATSTAAISPWNARSEAGTVSGVLVAVARPGAEIDSGARVGHVASAITGWRISRH